MLNLDVGTMPGSLVISLTEIPFGFSLFPFGHDRIA